jgi:hypothetical protein
MAKKGDTKCYLCTRYTADSETAVPAVFSSVRDLCIHIRRVHVVPSVADGTVLCFVCALEFSSAAEAMRHMHIRHNHKEVHTCSGCFGQFECAAYFAVHRIRCKPSVYSIPRNKTVWCIACNKRVFASRYAKHTLSPTHRGAVSRSKTRKRYVETMKRVLSDASVLDTIEFEIVSVEA